MPKHPDFVYVTGAVYIKEAQPVGDFPPAPVWHPKYGLLGLFKKKEKPLAPVPAAPHAPTSTPSPLRPRHAPSEPGWHPVHQHVLNHLMKHATPHGISRDVMEWNSTHKDYGPKAGTPWHIDTVMAHAQKHWGDKDSAWHDAQATQHQRARTEWRAKLREPEKLSDLEKAQAHAMLQFHDTFDVVHSRMKRQAKERERPAAPAPPSGWKM